MVEFALVVPILLALVFGIISYGYMLSYRQAVTQAASEGSRSAALAPATVAVADRTDRARSAVNRSLESYGVRCTETGSLTHHGTTVGTCVLTSATCEGSSSDASCVSVSIRHDYRDHPLIPSFPGLGITLPSTVEYTSVVETS
ncbi:pilus assembly protein [Aeromicrobium sp. YIM 150415]|uniref:TadE/TadG family type IV pilus assembly protein n=1 Tax=Aeromicrobium sp. YIM 150415 TaxID=2803912 RepID=UPI0019661EA6|nr:TadE/TadG family type IV pilus assembly protein [Aeromicrobium sp. YIM 150415]MBM9464439.1 pilus assembly protein [Aeromicrobium sp. YIM 150415]